MVEWMGWRVNSLVSWLVGCLVSWLIEILEIKQVMLSDLTSFPRQIRAISDFSRQTEKQGIALECSRLKARKSQGKYIRKRSSFDVSNIITYVRFMWRNR